MSSRSAQLSLCGIGEIEHCGSMACDRAFARSACQLPLTMNKNGAVELTEHATTTANGREGIKSVDITAIGEAAGRERVTARTIATSTGSREARDQSRRCRLLKIKPVGRPELSSGWTHIRADFELTLYQWRLRGRVEDAAPIASCFPASPPATSHKQGARPVLRPVCGRGLSSVPRAVLRRAAIYASM